MTGPLRDILTTVSQAQTSRIVLTLALTALALALHGLHVRFRDKGAGGALALMKWLAALEAVHELDEGVLLGQWDMLAAVLYCVVIWLGFRSLLHDVYADLYLIRIKKRPPNRILLNLLSFVMLIFLAAWGLRSALNVDVGSLLTSSAILTAVIGFSMQDTIGSLFSGLLIQTEKPFQIGDWIKLGDLEGQVAEITWRYTKLVTTAQDQLLIPNNMIAKDKVMNLSQPVPQVRLTIPIPAPVNTPPVKVKSALEEVLRKSPQVAQSPAPRVRLFEIGQDRLEYRIMFFVEDYEQAVAARSEVLSAVWYEFKKQGIDIPAPRQALVARRRQACAVPGDLLKLMGGIGLFAGTPPEELELLAQCSAVRTYPPGALIMERGQTGTTMFIIVSGKVAVSRDGRELSRLGSGDVVGEMALLTGEPRQADVTAIEPVSCLEVDREAFRGVLEKNPVLVANVTRAFQHRESQMRGAARIEAPDSAEGLFDRFRRIFW